jgi:hypothetical protein
MKDGIIGPVTHGLLKRRECWTNFPKKSQNYGARDERVNEVRFEREHAIQNRESVIGTLHAP